MGIGYTLSKTKIGGLFRHAKGKQAFTIAILALLVLTVLFAVSALEDKTTDAAPISAATVASDITNLTDINNTYTFSGEPDGVVTITLGATDAVDRIIDGANLPLPAISGQLQFNITNAGTGSITFKNMTLANPSSFATSGGMNLNGGKYIFDNCTFIGLTRTAVNFAGSSNSADFTNCTFQNNTAKGIVLSGGTSTSGAEFNIQGCYFDNNSFTGSGALGSPSSKGGAIGANSQITNATININSCVFTNNKNIGNATNSGGNNNNDGGAIGIVAGPGGNVSLNVWDSYFEANTAQDDGGAILVEGSQNQFRINSDIWNCTFIGNIAKGASYFGSTTVLGSTVTAGITNGSGGAICYYGLTDSFVTNCTFYNNGVSNTYTGPGTNCGNIGGGGAIGVDTDDNITDPTMYPPCPVLSNNIFVGNYVTKNIITASSLITSATGQVLDPSANTGNVFVMKGANADYQDPLVYARPITNNGNVGYDSGNTEFDTRNAGTAYVTVIFLPVQATTYADDLGTDTSAGLTVDNVFINVVGGVPVKEVLGEVGASGNTGTAYYLEPSPRTDELYRDGSGPYYDSSHTLVDAKGNPRDVFPSAGAIEIYWTKFNPGTEGDWSGTIPTTIDNPASVSDPYYVVSSLNFSTNEMYYVVTDIGLPSPEIVAMPRSSLTPDTVQYGFAGWRSSQPDPNWWDQTWADDNGYTETNLSDFLLAHFVSELPIEAFPLYQPGELLPSTKQTLTAEWNNLEYRVDFSLNYADPPVHPTAVDNYWLPSLSDITAGGYDSAGSTIVAPPYVGVLGGDHIIQPKADPVRAGYMFMGWYKNPTLQDAWNFGTDTVTEDIVLYASWAESRPVVFHSTDGAFAVTGDTETYIATIGSLIPKPGTVSGLPAPTYGGYTLQGWYVGDENGVDFTTAHFWSFSTDTVAVPDPPNNVIPYEALHLYAKWVQNSVNPQTIFKIDASSDSGATITPSGTTYVTYGDNVTFTFKAKSGFEITSVLVDGKAISAADLAYGSYTFTAVNSNHTIEVVTKVAGGSDEGGGTEPGGKTSGGSSGNWALLNLICAILAIIAGIIAVIGGKDRFEKDNVEKRSAAAVILRVLALVIGIVSLIVFFLTEDWSLPTAAVDEWTILMVILFIVVIILGFVSFRFDEHVEKEK